MSTLRQQKVSRLIQKDLNEIFLQEIKLPVPAMLSITVVRISPDLSFAKVYVSVFPSNFSPEVLKYISTHSNEIRHKLAVRIKKQARKAPELAFYIDDSLDYAENIEQLLNK